MDKIDDDEAWVKGYEGLYSVDLDGFVRTHQNRVKGLKYLRQTKHKTGYLVVTFSKDKEQEVFKVHQLIADAFLEKLPHHECINHKDGNKENNAVWNLERCTFSHNRQHAEDNGLRIAPSGVNHYSFKNKKA